MHIKSKLPALISIPILTILIYAFVYDVDWLAPVLTYFSIEGISIPARNVTIAFILFVLLLTVEFQIRFSTIHHVPPRHKNLKTVCENTITAINRNEFSPKIARRLRNALDDVDSPLGQYLDSGQRIIFREEQDE
jgi:hypothetical protein